MKKKTQLEKTSVGKTSSGKTSPAKKEKKVLVEIKYYKKLYTIQEVEVDEDLYKKLKKFDDQDLNECVKATKDLYRTVESITEFPDLDDDQMLYDFSITKVE
jgi:hypothetical protein